MIRKKLLASIHIAKAALKLDDETYRGLIHDLFKKPVTECSAAKLNLKELALFANHLQLLQKRNGLNTDGVRNEAMIKKCEALWIELRKAGAVNDGSKAALESFIKNRTGATALRMANGKQLYQAVEALKSWLARAKDKG